MSERALDRYIQRANEDIAESASRVRELELGKAFARLELLYRKASEAGQYNVARRIQHDISELAGILPSRVKVGVTAPPGSTAAISIAPPERRTLTWEERAVEVTRLLRLARSRGAQIPDPDDIAGGNDDSRAPDAA